MIKLESAHIEEVRGIRKLDIDFQKGTGAKPSSPRMNRLPGPCGTRGGGDKKRLRRHRDKMGVRRQPGFRHEFGHDGLINRSRPSQLLLPSHSWPAFS